LTGVKGHPGQLQLQALVDGELPEAERRRLSGHLDYCPSCRGEVRALETLFGELGTVEREIALPLSPRFSRRVMAEILRRETAARVRRNRVLLPAAAAVLAALVLAALLMPPLLPAGPATAGGALVMGALLSVVHSIVIVFVEGFDLAGRLTRTVVSLGTAVPGPIWAIFLSLTIAVHGALAYCLRQYGRRRLSGAGRPSGGWSEPR
jgi:anti-sigma factor RsiW